MERLLPKATNEAVQQMLESRRFVVLEGPPGTGKTRTMAALAVSLVKKKKRVLLSALSNMALFDMPEIEPLFRVLPKLLKPNGTFVFSLMHPAFNNPSAALMAEEWDDGELHTRYAVKVPRYMTAFTSNGLALRSQPQPQLYFHRPLQDYLNLAFQNGFILDGFAERAFPPDHPQVSTLGWGGKFSEIPPVVILRLRLASSNYHSP